MKNSVTFLLLTVLFVSTLEANLPPDFQTCKQNDPNLSACLKSAIQDALPKLKNGIPDLKVSPLEPLRIPSVTIGEGTGAVHVVQSFKNFNIYGISDALIKDMRASITPNNFESDLHMFFPEVKIKADYELNGRILLLPVVGSGKCTIILKDVEIPVKMANEIFEKKGKMYWRVKDFSIELNPGKVIYNFENLFNGDATLGQEMNNVLNENWKDVFDDVKAGYAEVLATVSKDYTNKIFAKVPREGILTK